MMDRVFTELTRRGKPQMKKAELTRGGKRK